MSIQPLPRDVVAQIKSSIVVTSLNGAVCGLLRNSLDAGASRINISVDYSRGNCSVEDNGLGIEPASFQDDGGLGKLHYTSKYPPPPNCHGKRGEFLASLASLSLLFIASHHRDYRTHNSLTIHNSRVVSRNLPAPLEQRLLTFASGTRVVVRDLFGSMPVRVKQRAMETERVGTSRDFERLIFSIVAHLLPWPGEMMVSVQDSYARRTVALSSSEMVEWSRSSRSTAPGILSRTTTLLAQASMVDSETLGSWVPIGATASGISVRGCVSLHPVATKRVQFIALGIQPLLNEHLSGLFYEDVNHVFEDSCFGVLEEPNLDDEGYLAKTQGFTSKELRRKRGIDRWPMFFLQIMLSAGTDPVNVEQFLHERRQNVAIISDLLQMMAYEFLKKHHFRPRSITAIEKLKRERGSSGASPPRPPLAPFLARPKRRTNLEAKRPRLRPESQRHTSSAPSMNRVSESRAASPFAVWSRTKSGVPEHMGTKSPAVWTPPTEDTFNSPPAERQPPAGAETPLFDKYGALLRKPFDDAIGTGTANVLEHELPGTALSSESRTARETVVWEDPNTKIKQLIDARTGFAVKSRNHNENRFIPQSTRRQEPRNVSQAREWNPTKSGKQNTIFQAIEPRIARIIQPPETVHRDQSTRNNEFCALAADTSNGNMRATLESRISKVSLQEAEIITQVDQKFILAKVAAIDPSSSTDRVAEVDRMLILIDQHAADERCRVETLLKAYFVPDPAGSPRLVAQKEKLDKPMRFDLSRQDGELLVRFKGHFAHWGVVYDVIHGQEAPSQKGVTVEVQFLPPSVLERCRLEPRLLVDLLRKEIWKLHAMGSGGASGLLHAGADKDWVARFHDCPEGILDLINSRACRSAIMFNDPLTVQQCTDLVQGLAACAFPFQCAHGRPSMVPLVYLGQDCTLGSGNAEPRGNGNLLEALKEWKRNLEDTD